MRYPQMAGMNLVVENNLAEEANPWALRSETCWY